MSASLSDPLVDCINRTIAHHSPFILPHAIPISPNTQSMLLTGAQDVAEQIRTLDAHALLPEMANQHQIGGAPNVADCLSVDFALCDVEGGLKPKLVEVQAFPSLNTLCLMLEEHFAPGHKLDGRDIHERRGILLDAITGGLPRESVLMLDYEPYEQASGADFWFSQEFASVRGLYDLHREGRTLFYYCKGKKVPVKRIYNRLIISALSESDQVLAKTLLSDVDAEFFSHPDWFCLTGKHLLAYFDGPNVPPAWQLNNAPSCAWSDAVAKPYFDFGGQGINLSPHPSMVGDPKWKDYVLQQRLRFSQCVKSPITGKSLYAEVRIMMVLDAQGKYIPITQLARVNRRPVMGVSKNQLSLGDGASVAICL